MVQTLEQRVLPTTVWVASTQNGTEGGQNAAINLQRDNTSGVLNVIYMADWSGTTAQAGSDYSYLSSVATFADGQNTATINVNILDDASLESTETLKIDLWAMPSSQYSLGSSYSGTVHILDNDAPTNAPPLITTNQNAFEVNHDMTLNVTSPFVSGSDVNGHAVSLQLVSNVSHGSLTLNSDATFSYTPATQYVGSDSFQVRYVDSLGAASNTVTVSLSVTNIAPHITVNQNSFMLNHDQTLNVASPAVNGVDAAGDQLTLQLVSNVAHGTLNLNSNGTFSYTPAAHYVGADAFQVRFVDSLGAASNSVTILLSMTNVSPMFANSHTSVSVNENTAVGTTILDASATDMDDLSLAYSILSGNGGGYFSIDASGQLKVASALDFEAMSQHQFNLVVEARDSVGATVTRNITVDVLNVNDPPKLQNFQFSTNDGVTYTFTGQVIDEAFGACTIDFGGVLHGHTSGLTAGGTFSYTVTLGGSTTGLVSAKAIDPLGQTSANSYVYI